MIRNIAVGFLVLLSSVTLVHADQAPLIVIDRWWGIDYAKNGCHLDETTREGNNKAVCEQKRTENYNVFELELKTQFAALQECEGITVSSFGYPQKRDPKEKDIPDLTKTPYWSFSVNYFGDNPEQLWQMLPPKGSDLPMMEATGTPSQIAKQVCTIIKGKGGIVH